MRIFVSAALCMMLLILLPGCWNSVELDQWSFVQGIAIDRAETGEIELTVQIYRPTSSTQDLGAGGGVSEAHYINVKTRDDSVFEAIRDITVHLGRKAQWSHMRVLIISEEIAKVRNIGELLEFFSRDHEPRGTAYVMVGKGRADQYLKVKPFIESSMSQQIRSAEKMTYKFAGKTLQTNFLNLIIQLKSQTEVALMPYIYFDPKNHPQTAPVTGLVSIRKGKMDFLIPSKRIESLLMLMNKYKSGVIQIQCPKESMGIKKYDSVEVDAVKTKTNVKLDGDSVSVQISVLMKGFAGELVCTSLKTPEDMENFNHKVAETIEKEIRESLELIQKEKIDVLGIGNRVYRKDPALWKRWKPEWEERFAQTPFTITVKAEIMNTGANLGIPVGQ